MTGPAPSEGDKRRSGVKAAAGALTVLVAALVAHGVLTSPGAPGAPAPPTTVRDTALVALDATHVATVTRSDSIVTITISGADHPLVVQAYPGSARAWATTVDSVAHAAVADSVSPAPPGAALWQNSDVLRYQRVGAPAGSSSQTVQHSVSVTVGPNALPLYLASVPSSTLDSLTAAVRRAAGG